MQQKIYYFLAALALVGVLGWVITSSNPKIRRTVRSTTDFITPSTPLAFGDFSAGALVGRTNTQAVTPTAAGTVTTDAAKELTVAPNTVVTFTYSGDTFSLPTLPVLRRDVATHTSFSAGSFLGLPNYFSIESFHNLRLESLSMTEQASDGYTLSVDMQRGVSSLYQKSTVTTEKTLTNGSTAPSLTNSQAITLAQRFLETHAIATDHFGAPVVQDAQIYALPMTDAARMPYSSPVVTITFPWLIEGTPVVDQGGAPYGLQVTIDTTTESVTGVSNIAELRFTGSDYPLLTDPKTVLSVAQRGGVYSTASTDPKAVSISLGAPVAVYMISSYQLSNDGVDYLVPALSFPLQTVPNGVTWYQKNIVVPLIDSLLNAPDAVSPDAPSVDSGSGTSSSSGSAILDPSVKSTTSQPE